MPDIDNHGDHFVVRFLAWFGSTPAGARTIINVGTVVDRWLIKATGGKYNSTFAWPCLLLTTTGAKTGLPRTAALVYIKDGNDYCLVASKGGNARHPAWYLNLKADPEAEIFVEGKTISCVAREAEGGERERIWEKAVELYSGYEKYQKRAGGRKIPVMILTPKS